MEDFEAAAGVAPSYMALTAIDVATGLPDVEAWCNIGNLATCIAPANGSFSLEMGLLPGSTNYHDVQNAMVLGLDGAGTTDLYLSMLAHNGGEESDVFDGVWISDDGVNWHSVGGNPWSSLVPTGNAWTAAYNVDLTATPASTSGTFYLMIAQEDNFPYVGPGTGTASDGMGFDDIQVTESQLPIPPPLPQNFPWVVLPASFVNVAGGWNEDFEAAAGVVQPYMGVTELEAVGFTPSTNASANIGQNGAFATVSNSGSYHLELFSRVSGSPNTVNALTFGLNGAGATDFDLSFYLDENADELGTYDGVFISDNGTDWTRVHDGQGPGVWTQVTGVDLTFQGQNPVNLSGDFYLMFLQSDNSTWTGGDGNAYDDINVGPLPPTPPTVALNGVCGANPSSVDVSGATPGGQVAVVAGTVLSAVTVPASRPCAGIQLDVVPVMQFLQIGVADANGDFSVTGGGGAIPANACGLFHVQAVDITTCLTSNVLSL